MHYRERLHLLPGLGTCYPTPPAASGLSRAALGLPGHRHLAVCAQSPFKWSPQFTRSVGRFLSPRQGNAGGVRQPARKPPRVFDAYLQHHFAPLRRSRSRAACCACRSAAAPTSSPCSPTAISRSTVLAFPAATPVWMHFSRSAGAHAAGRVHARRQTMAMLRCLPERFLGAARRRCGDYAFRPATTGDAPLAPTARGDSASKSRCSMIQRRCRRYALGCRPADRSPTVAFC